jgi:hypothetical protein
MQEDQAQIFLAVDLKGNFALQFGGIVSGTGSIDPVSPLISLG